MRLALKVFNRLRREVRHALSYAKAQIINTQLTEGAVVAGWKSSSGRAHPTMKDCIEEWVGARPVLLSADLDGTTNTPDLVKRADLLVHGPITILQNPCSLRPPNLWHEDPQTHQVWASQVHFTRYNVFHSSHDGITDIRRLWEIGRFGWALPLAQAYAVTHEETYFQAWNDYVQSFLDRNRPEYGPHWLNAMEPAIRAIQWCRALTIFLSKSRLPSEPLPGLPRPYGILHAALPSLLSHGRYIASHLEWTPYGRTNHYIADLVGLLALAAFIPQFKESARWRRLAVRHLSHEIEVQTDRDGFHAEASTAYHHFAVELYAVAAALDREHNLGFPQRFHERVQQMAQVDLTIRGHENLDPRIGDDDSGTLHLPTRLIRPTSETRPPTQLLPSATATETNQFNSHALGVSGIYILRSPSLTCFVSCGPNGQEGVGGHAHNDKLSIVVHAAGQPLIVDSGTYCYSADVRTRDLFRSTRMHNTLMVDETEQNELQDWRKLTDRTHAQCTAWRDSAYETFFSGQHQGYSHVGIHRRVIQLDKVRHRLNILDEIETHGIHQIDFFLHLSPTIRREQVKLEAQRVSLPGASLSFPPDLALTLEEARHSPIYGLQVSSLRLHGRMRSVGKVSLAWELHIESGRGGDRS